MTTNIQKSLPAEWEEQSGILLSWPHESTDWKYMLKEVQACFHEIARNIINDENLIIVSPNISDVQRQLSDMDCSKIRFYQIDTNDTWARDFGPVTINDNGSYVLCDFKFNAWGLKFPANYDNLINGKLSILNAFNYPLRNHLNFVLEGGSIESNGEGVVMTTSQCLLSKNRNGEFSRHDIERTLSDTLGARKILWLNHGSLEGDDTDSHIDTLARFAPNDTIIYVGCDDTSDSHFMELSQMEKEIENFTDLNGKSFNLVRLPMPDAIYDEDGERLPATYANFLIMNNRLLMPTYGQARKDDLAINMMKIAFPEHDIIGIDCNALIKQHGSLHCVTMQFPKDVLAL